LGLHSVGTWLGERKSSVNRGEVKSGRQVSSTKNGGEDTASQLVGFKGERKNVGGKTRRGARKAQPPNPTKASNKGLQRKKKK